MSDPVPSGAPSLRALIEQLIQKYEGLAFLVEAPPFSLIKREVLSDLRSVRDAAGPVETCRMCANCPHCECRHVMDRPRQVCCEVGQMGDDCSCKGFSPKLAASPAPSPQEQTRQDLARVDTMGNQSDSPTAPTIEVFRDEVTVTSQEYGAAGWRAQCSGVVAYGATAREGDL